VLTRAAPDALDAADPLASFRDRFVIGEDVIYLDGNSLGRSVLGAAPRQVAVTDSTTVNLYKLASAALDAEYREVDASPRPVT
jgi:kynureninase